MSQPSLLLIREWVRTALAEDLSVGDLTTSSLFPRPHPARASIVARQAMVVGGLAVACETFLAVDPGLTLRSPVGDGETVREGTTVLIIEGDGRSLLMAERVALNFMQRLSGIATLTQRFCQAVRGFPTRILDTRKTTPGLRALEKWAVRLGGGRNHRFSLGDGLLIKDNHLSLLRAEGSDLRTACRRARAEGSHGLKVIVETSTLADVKEAVKGQADVILLDNMALPMVHRAIGLIKGSALVEVSGGVSLSTARALAQAGADFLSVGALTHSAPAADLSMDLVSLRKRTRPVRT